LLEEFAMNEGKSFVTKVYFFNIDWTLWWLQRTQISLRQKYLLTHWNSLRFSVRAEGIMKLIDKVDVDKEVTPHASTSVSDRSSYLCSPFSRET
jgi:hypothetical protein